LLGLKLAIKEYYPTGVAVRNTTSRMVISASPDAREDFHRGMEKFLEEARILARFEAQPNIVSVRDFFQENGTAYMVMTYLEGRTLLKYLDERGGRIPFGEAMETLSPIMDALDEVHAAGLIHRDISPDNIFVTHNGQVKLLDFGASKSALNLMQQKSHSVILKRGYSPPEQYQSRGSLGPWTDVYGMAATLYRAVTGQVPPDSLDRLGEDTLTLDGDMERMIPLLAREGLLLGLSLSPKARPQSMREFKERLLGKTSDTSGRTDEQQASAGVNAPEMLQLAPEKENKKGKSRFPQVVVVLAVLIIIGLSFFLSGASFPGRPVAPLPPAPQPSPVTEVGSSDPKSLYSSQFILEPSDFKLTEGLWSNIKIMEEISLPDQIKKQLSKNFSILDFCSYQDATKDLYIVAGGIETGEEKNNDYRFTPIMYTFEKVNGLWKIIDRVEEDFVFAPWGFPNSVSLGFFGEKLACIWSGDGGGTLRLLTGSIFLIENGKFRKLDLEDIVFSYDEILSYNWTKKGILCLVSGNTYKLYYLKDDTLASYSYTQSHLKP
ncbi:MAG: serine/threonine protein kinase, partial [Bacteroidia bacterium]|nr:serine/threonine protein kinase [Bacteroidia bacterium]